MLDKITRERMEGEGRKSGSSLWGGQLKSKARQECVGESGEWGRIRWIRSDSWLWPDSFKGGWGQKLDH